MSCLVWSGFKKYFIIRSPIDLADVLPRLWPYVDHSTSSVRKATLQTLRTLTRPLVTSTSTSTSTERPANGDQPAGAEPADTQYLSWTPELLQEAMRYVYQRI